MLLQEVPFFAVSAGVSRSRVDLNGLTVLLTDLVVILPSALLLLRSVSFPELAHLVHLCQHLKAAQRHNRGVTNMLELIHHALTVMSPFTVHLIYYGRTYHVGCF